MLGNVIVRLENGDRLMGCVPLQCPPTSCDELGPITPGMDQFSFPPASLKQFGIYFLEWRAEHFLHELVRDTADCFYARPAVSFFGAAIPIGDYVVHIADEDRLVREVKETGLLP